MLLDALPQPLGARAVDLVRVLGHAGVFRIAIALGAVLALAFFVASVVKKAPKFQFLAELAIGIALVIWLPMAGSWFSQETGIFKDKERDYAYPAAAHVLKVVITDWMTNPKVKAAPYSYLIDPADMTGKGPRPRLKRLLIDESSVPKGFHLEIPNVPTELVDRSKRVPEKGEMCITVYRFEPKWDGSIEIKFLHEGYAIIGGDRVTYSARKENGKWSAKLLLALDP